MKDTAYRRGNRTLAFGWYGGKFSHLGWLLPMLPPCRTFVDAYGGSGAVLLNRPLSPIDVYNDLDGDVVNFFRVLREHRDQLMEAIDLTPYSREEFALSCSIDYTLDHIERARRFFVRANQVTMNLVQRATPGMWSYSKDCSRRGVEIHVSKWLNKKGGLVEVSERFCQVLVENKPAIEVIDIYDTPETLTYCDPTYLESERNGLAYGYEMTESDHIGLFHTVNACQGRVAVSGYESPMYTTLYRRPKWRKTLMEDRVGRAFSGSVERTEALWTNYDPLEVSA